MSTTKSLEAAKVTMNPSWYPIILMVRMALGNAEVQNDEDHSSFPLKRIDFPNFGRTSKTHKPSKIKAFGYEMSSKKKKKEVHFGYNIDVTT